MRPRHSLSRAHANRDDAYRPALEAYIGSVQQRAREGSVISQTADEVAAVIADAIAQEDPPVRVRTSAWAEALCQLKTDLDPEGRALQQQVVDLFLPGFGDG